VNLETVVWNEQTYEDFLKYLRSFSDEKYKAFNEKIINDELKTELIGIRAPIMRTIAKRIAKGDYEGFLKYNGCKTHEERMLRGIIIGLAEVGYAELMQMLKDFVPYLSNWGLVDMTVVRFKQIKANRAEGLKEIIEFTRSDNPWEIRLGLSLLIALYVDGEYIQSCLDIAASIRNRRYYVIMGNAWLLSECYAKFPDQTSKLLEKNILDAETQNKTVQKIRESFRVSPQAKESVLKYKIKNQHDGLRADQ
jgi:3-methyladenine DNA glycosylase AlkD